MLRSVPSVSASSSASNVSENVVSPTLTVHLSPTVPTTLTVPVVVCAEAAPAKPSAAAAIANETGPNLIFHLHSSRLPPTPQTHAAHSGRGAHRHHQSVPKRL